MKVVIDVENFIYEAIKDVQDMFGRTVEGNTLLQRLMRAVQNGTPLPKGHGRLIDADAFQDRLTRQRWTFRSVKEYKEMMLRINDAPTIIEADKGVEE